MKIAAFAVSAFAVAAISAAAIAAEALAPKALADASARAWQVAQAAGSDDGPRTIIADQVRRQGLACDNPRNAERVPGASRPDEAVWLLKCENATYRVHLVPDLAARIERVE